MINGIPKEDIKTKSDCEIILHLYIKMGIEKLVNMLDGEFAFIIIDTNKKQFYFARDIFGIKPLYYSYDGNELFISSEIKAIYNNVNHVLPRVLYNISYANDKSIFSTMDYYQLTYNPNPYSNNFKIMQKLKLAVIKRIKQANENIDVGFLLSGGLDSSITTSLALEYYSKQENKYVPNLYTIGFEENAPDIKSAKIMVEWLKQRYGDKSFKWHLVILPINDGISALNDVIWHLETYDTTTIRASTPMYLISQYIKKYTPTVKVIISGEGSDELFGGYLYFKYAPNDFAFRSEIIYLLNNLYLYDVLRADRTTAAFGLEVRPPFLDKELIETVLSSYGLTYDQDTTKKLLRDCLKGQNLLPNEILIGKKEAFSDAVGYNWKKSITDYCSKVNNNIIENHNINDTINNNDINDTINNNDINYMTNTTTDNNDLQILELNNYQKIISMCHIKPETNEQFHYQKIFVQLFGNQLYLLPKYWLPNQQWVNTGSEPSATILNCYNKKE
jgi:asparagine synthase (glutamine-hydrolysing)